MKTLFYVTLFVVGLMLPASEGVRLATIGLIKGVVSEVERLVLRGDYAEVRSVDGETFDKVIVERNRVVIVVFHDKLKSTSRSELHNTMEAIKKLPRRVLLAKVTAEANKPLLDKLGISVLPTIRVYQAGRLVRDFGGEMAEEELVSVVNDCLNRKKYGPGYIGPMDKNWIPDGVQRSLSRPKAPASKLE